WAWGHHIKKRKLYVKTHFRHKLTNSLYVKESVFIFEGYLKKYQGPNPRLKYTKEPAHGYFKLCCVNVHFHWYLYVLMQQK
ncbi:hypothetical protein COO00_30285, partial [Bacillus toyonensis]